MKLNCEKPYSQNLSHRKNIFTKYIFDKGLYSNYTEKSGTNNLIKNV